MKTLLNRLLSFVIAFLLVFGCFTAIPKVKTDVSAAYENTHTNTGDPAYDIVAVAQTQIGYQEGSNNSNKYSAAFGVYNVAWCAYFISWCAKEAGISDSIINRQGIASPFSGYFNVPNTHGSSNYFPKPGDLVFYGPNSNGDHYHVGIVETVNKSTGYITTIEGNTNSNGSSEGYIVYRHTRHYQHQNICCYGIPNYPDNHQIDASYGTNFTAYPKETITAENIFDANHSQISSTAWIGTSDLCTIHEVYTDGCCLVSYPLDSGGTKTVYTYTSLFNIHTHSYTGQRVYEIDHPHVITQRCIDYASCGGYIVTGEYAQSKTCQQCWCVNWYVSESSISVKVGQSESVSISIDGIWPDTATLFLEWDESLFNYTLSQGVLTVTGLKSGRGKISISIYSDSNKSYLIGSKSIAVTVSAVPTYTYLSVNSYNIANVSTAGETVCYKYTPSETAKYVIYSTGSADTKVYLYDANITEIAHDDNGGDDTNFRLEYTLTAGTEYIFGVKYINLSATGTIPFVFGRVYTIKYNDNGGTGAPDFQSKDFAKNITLSTTSPAKKGCTFLGWSTNSSATSATYQLGDTFSVDENTTLYAVWQSDSYTVTFKDWDGTTLSTQTVKYGSAATAPSDPARTGYTFTGWDKTFSSITANTTVTAKYSVNFYTVTFKDWDGTTLKTQTVNYGSAVSAPANPTRTGYSFTGWDKSFSNITANTTVTAKYSINTYTVTFKDWDGTTLKTQSVNYGTAATAPSNPTRTGYTFTGWDKSFSNITANTTVTALYTKKNDNYPTYTVTLTDNGDGTAHIAAKLPAGVASGKIVIDTSDKLSYVIGSLSSVSSAVINENYSGGMLCVSFSNTNVFAADTVVFEADFLINGSASLSVSDFTVTEWNLTDGDIRLASEADGDVIKIFEEISYKLGDANGDDKVDNLDSTIMLKYDAGLIDESKINLKASDVNGDRRVDNLDATRVLKYDAGLISSFS